MAAYGTDIHKGMLVYSQDGEKLGKVVRCDVSSMLVEKGLFFPKDYLIKSDHIIDVRGDDIYLDLTRDRLTQLQAGDTTTTTAAPSTGYTSTTGTLGRSEDVRIPVVEEQLDINKTSREKGAVRVTKEVVTETKQVNVPITREEVRVERIPVDSPRTATGSETNFQGGTVTVPIREEEVEIRKRPVVKEEVRISKEARREDMQVNEKLRKEKVDIDRDVEEKESTYRRTDLGDTGAHTSGVDSDMPLTKDDKYKF